MPLFSLWVFVTSSRVTFTFSAIVKKITRNGLTSLASNRRVSNHFAQNFHTEDSQLITFAYPVDKLLAFPESQRPLPCLQALTTDL